MIPDALADALRAPPVLAVAVSGGVDSMTLAHAAAMVRQGPTRMVHAVSPAVTEEATARVRRHAEASGWALDMVEAGEFADPDYLRNPVNRCYFCKSNLYDRIGGLVEGAIASGANMDDLGDYRPGLQAASERQVIHPFVTARMGKPAVRALARILDLDDVAELPAQPCLASRIETGLRVTPEDLAFVERTERTLADLLGPGDLRCRIVAGGVRIEVSEPDDPPALAARAKDLCDAAGRPFLGLAPYRRGSAFLR